MNVPYGINGTWLPQFIASAINPADLNPTSKNTRLAPGISIIGDLAETILSDIGQFLPIETVSL